MSVDIPRPGRPRRSAHLLLGCALAFAMVGCPHGQGPHTDTLPLVQTDDPDAERDMRQAREAAEAGHLDEARHRYRTFLTEHPDDPLAPIAQLALGRMALAKGDLDEARGLLERVAANPDAAVAARGHLYLGVVEHLAGDDLRAIELLRPLVGSRVDPQETALLLRTLAEASRRTGNLVEAITALDALLAAPVPEETLQQARAALGPAVAQEARPEEIETLYAQLPRDGAAWPLVAERTLRDRFAAGDMSAVHDVANDLRAHDVPLDDPLLAMIHRAERDDSVDPRVVGAILPLSGRGREVGQLAMRGLMLAAGGPSEGPSLADPTQVVFRDSGGDPERAARAVEELVQTHHVIAIVGPMDGAAAARAAARAAELGVPLVTLTPAPGITDAGPTVFRLFFTPEGEVHDLVAAARARGARRFAVMYPDHGYGQAMRALFAGEVASQGGELVAEESYPAHATTFRDAIRALRGSSIDALFVPDDARQISLIAPALASAGLWNAPGATDAGATSAHAPSRSFTLLLPSVAYGDQLLRTTGRYLQGAILSQPFHAATATDEAGRFVRSFEARFGAAPDMFAAYAYDALQLVRSTVDSGAVTRDQLADRLPLTAGAATAGPSRGLTASRGPVHGTRLLEVRGADLVPFAP